MNIFSVSDVWESLTGNLLFPISLTSRNFWLNSLLFGNSIIPGYYENSFLPVPAHFKIIILFWGEGGGGGGGDC